MSIKKKKDVLNDQMGCKSALQKTRGLHISCVQATNMVHWTRRKTLRRSCMVSQNIVQCDARTFDFVLVTQLATLPDSFFSSSVLLEFYFLELCTLNRLTVIGRRKTRSHQGQIRAQSTRKDPYKNTQANRRSSTHVLLRGAPNSKKNKKRVRADTKKQVEYDLLWSAFPVKRLVYTQSLVCSWESCRNSSRCFPQHSNRNTRLWIYRL